MYTHFIKNNKNTYKMKNETNYNNWPVMVKITTALSGKSFYIKNHKPTLYLGYLVLFSGVASFIYLLFNAPISVTSNDFLNAVSLTIVGLASIATGKSIDWVNNNSSWEERFANTSSAVHKFLYIFISLVLLACIIIMFMTGGL